MKPILEFIAKSKPTYTGKLKVYRHNSRFYNDDRLWVLIDSPETLIDIIDVNNIKVSPMWRKNMLNHVKTSKEVDNKYIVVTFGTSLGSPDTDLLWNSFNERDYIYETTIRVKDFNKKFWAEQNWPIINIQ